jgi:hypothetical protein
MKLASFTFVAACAMLVALVAGAGMAGANSKGQNGLIAFDLWTGASHDIGGLPLERCARRGCPVAQGRLL